MGCKKHIQKLYGINKNYGYMYGTNTYDCFQTHKNKWLFARMGGKVYPQLECTLCTPNGVTYKSIKFMESHLLWGVCQHNMQDYGAYFE